MSIRLVKSVDEAFLITHAGKFHADECMATAIISKRYSKELTLARVFKAPDPENFIGIIYDIGGGSLDHHQLGGNGCHANGIPYAACGLVWRTFGRMLLQEKYLIDDDAIDKVFNKIEFDLICGIDAIDNGINDTLYQMYNISSIISPMNPSWDEGQDKSDSLFMQAVEFCETLLDRVITRTISTVKAKTLVEKAISKAKSENSKVIIFDQYLPWQDTVYEKQEYDGFLYVVFPSNRGGYNVQAINVSKGDFMLRKSLPIAWRGNPSATGVPECTFVHNNGFIAACDTLESAIKLANLAVQA